MNDEYKDGLSVDDILNEYHASEAAQTRRVPSPEDEPTVVLPRETIRAAAPLQPEPPVQAAQTGKSAKNAQPAKAETPKKPSKKSKPVHNDDDYEYEVSTAYEEELARRQGSRWPVVAAILFLLLVLAVGAFAAYTFLCQTVFPGVSVGGVEVGGMTLNAAAKAIDEAYTGQHDGELTIEMDEFSYTLPVSDVVSGVDTTESARSAFLYGREGNPLDRALSIMKARFGGAEVELTMDVNKRQLAAWLDEIAGASMNEPVQPSYRVEEDNLIVDLGAPGVTFADRELVEAQLIEKLRKMDLEPLEVEADVKDPDPIDLTAIQAEIESEPKSATLDTKDGVTVIPGVDGVHLDIEKARSIIGDAVTGEFTIPLELTPAEIDAETLKSMLFRDTLAATQTKLNPNEKSRTHNVELACNYINGTILNPGDEFSYNTVVGKRTAARGFREAGIFVAGRLEEGLGGGVCQPSSTLYMAVLRADLKVTERSNHGMTVSYTPLGEDATVSWGTIDFRFVNDTEYPIKILASREGSYCKMTIVGTKTTDKKVEIKTNTLSKTNWETVRKLDTTLTPGTEKVDQSGSTGYKTETFKVITENGQTTTVKANTSTYKKRDKLVLYNDQQPAATTTPDTTTTPATDPTVPTVPTAPPVVDPVSPTVPTVPTDSTYTYADDSYVPMFGDPEA